MNMWDELTTLRGCMQRRGVGSRRGSLLVPLEKEGMERGASVDTPYSPPQRPCHVGTAGVAWRALAQVFSRAVPLAERHLLAAADALPALHRCAVPVHPLDEFLFEKVELLRIDTAGQEVAILQGR